VYHKQVALTLAAQGFRVFPLHASTGCDCGRTPGKGFGFCDEKAPRRAGWVGDAAASPDWVERSWTRDYGIGIATGEDFFVLDVDMKDGRDGLASLDALAAGRSYDTGLAAQTPSGGWHFYYRSPKGKRYTIGAGQIGEGLDHRCYSGYVVAPGTRVAAGEYRWALEGEEAEVPPWLLEKLTEKKPVTKNYGEVAYAGLTPRALTEADLREMSTGGRWVDTVFRVLSNESWAPKGLRYTTIRDFTLALQYRFGPLLPEPSALLFEGSCLAVCTEGADNPPDVGWVADWFADAARIVDWSKVAAERSAPVSLDEFLAGAPVRAPKIGRALGREEVEALGSKLSRKKDERSQKVGALLLAWKADGAAAWTAAETQEVAQKLAWELPSFDPLLSAGLFGAVLASPEAFAKGAAAGAKAALEKGKYDWDDLGNMQRFLKEHGERLRVVSSWNVKGEGPGRWIAYDGKRWAVEQAPSLVEDAAVRTVRGMEQQAMVLEDEDLRKAYLAWVKHSKTRGARQTMLADAKGSVELSISHDALDRDPWLLNVANGTLDLRSGVLRPHDPSDLMTKLAPVGYDPEATCPTWERMLLGSMNASPVMVDYLQRVLGYCLTGLVSEQSLFFAIGEGGNGKGTILNTVLEILGDYATKCPMDMLLATRQKAHETELTMLYRTRLALVSETEQGRSWAAAKLKELTGDDPITARRMREDHWTFLPTHKFIVLSNHEPVAHDQSYGMRRRLRCVPFEVSFEEGQRDTRLREKLRAELPGILAWAVRGCLAWQAQGLQEPEKVREAAESYWERQDTFAQFWDECCTVEGSSPETRREDMIAEYQAWCRLNGDEHPMRPKAFYARVRGVKGVEDKKSNGSRSWSGVALKTRLRGQGTWSPPLAAPVKRPN